MNYLNNNQPRFIVPQGQDAAEWFVENKFGVIGTPDDAIALIQRLYAKQGDFGVFLQQVHNWADFEQTKRSYELYQRYVMPHFSGDNRPRIESFDWCADNRDLTDRKAHHRRAGDVRQARGRDAGQAGRRCFHRATPERTGGWVGYAGGCACAPPSFIETELRRFRGAGMRASNLFWASLLGSVLVTPLGAVRAQ